MVVRELLLNALANAGHIHDGKSAEADELDLALRLFNSELKTLSNRNLITAFQKVLDIPEAKAECIIGGYRAQKGKRIYEFNGSLPSANGYVIGRDYALLDKKKWYKVIEATSQANAWLECNSPYECCETFSDIIVDDMERIITAMCRNSSGQWNRLRFVPLSMFYTENDNRIYCTSAEGEGRVRMILPPYHEGKPIKIVYNTSMSFGKNDNIDLPEAHITLVEIALTTALLRKDADSDPTRLNNYKEQLDSLMNDIMANTATERRIMRETEYHDDDALHSGSFIFR